MQVESIGQYHDESEFDRLYEVADNMRLFHLFVKLRKMPPQEIRFRIREKLRVWQERRRVQSTTPAHNASTAVADVDLAGNCLRLVPGAHSDQLSQLQSRFPHVYDSFAHASNERAQEVAAGDAKLLGHAVSLNQPLNWHADPRTDYVFERQFYADLPLYNLGGEVDVKYVWELGRHQFLVDLARGWRFSGNDQSAVLARDLMLSWITDNPQYQGVHWTSALELSMRAISWIWTIATLADSACWQPDDHAAISRSLREQAEYLEHHFSYYSSPYNHLVGEAAGLYLIGCALDGTDDASRWRRIGHSVLTEHGPRQFYSDGFCVEQATGYHFYTLGFMALAVAAARTWSEPLTQLEPHVHRAFSAGMAFRQPCGRWPAIGDVDSARAIPVHHSDFWNFDSICQLGGLLFDDPSLVPPGDSISEEAYWLLGCDALTSSDAVESVSVASAHVLPDSGYAIARSEKDWICFDAGPLGDGLHPDATPSTAHGHADALQILYSHQGRDVLIDAGMPYYFGDDNWVGHFRSAAAHNTIEIEGVEMARRAGTLAWSHVAPRPQMNVKLAESAWLMKGTARWSESTTVERYLFALPGRGLWVADRILSDQPRTTRWYWQLPEECLAGETTSTASGHGVVGPDGLQWHVWAGESNVVTTDWSTARQDSPVAWNAPGYGELRHGRRICVESSPADQMQVVTFIGSSPLPMIIRVGGIELACCPEDGLSSSAVPDRDPSLDGADIVWNVEIDGQWQTYVAGIPAKGAGDLNGVGDWPVSVASQVPSSVSSN